MWVLFIISSSFPPDFDEDPEEITRYIQGKILKLGISG